MEENVKTKRNNVYVCATWITLLHTWNRLNIVNLLYFSLKKFKWKKKEGARKKKWDLICRTLKLCHSVFKLSFIQVIGFVTWIVKAAQRRTGANGLNHRKCWILGPKDTLTLVGEVEFISSRASHFTYEKSKAQRAVFRNSGVPCRFSEDNLNW